MKRIVAVVILLSSICLAQGGTTSSNIFPANTGQNLGNDNQRWNLYAQDVNANGVITGSFSNLNNIRFADKFSGSDACSQINAAIADLPSTGGIVYATGFGATVSCLVNPFNAVTKSGTLYLGASTFQTTAQWQTPAGYKWTVRGIGRGDSSAHNTAIQAVSGFPTSGTAVARVGGSSSGTATHGTTFQDLTIDCYNIALEGFFSADANEMSGLKRVDIANCPSAGFDVTTMNAIGGAQNFVLDEVEVYPQLAGTAATVCGKIVGNVTGPQQVSNITCVANSITPSTNCFTIDKVTVGRFVSLHGEQCTNVINVGSNAAVDGVVFENISGGPVTTNVINISNSFSTQNIIASNTVTGGATNSIVNNISGKTFNDQKLSWYFYGNGVTPRPECSSSSGGNSCVLASLVSVGNLNLNGYALLDGTVLPASTGMIRLGTSQAINFRNTANSGDVNGLSKDASNVVQVGGSAGAKTIGPVTVSDYVSAVNGFKVNGATVIDSASKGTFSGGVVAGASGSTVADTRELLQTVHSCGSTTTCANTANLSERMVIGTVTLAAGSAVITGITAFTATSSYVCNGTDQTAAAVVKIANTSTTSITITGTGTDVISYICVGN